MYSAFLSYSRKNTDIAKRIHRSLELYRIPKPPPNQYPNSDVSELRRGEYKSTMATSRL